MDDLLYRRHLPHWIPDSKVVHLVFRLAGSLPQPKPDILRKNTLPKRLIVGPNWLGDSRIAEILQNTLMSDLLTYPLRELSASIIWDSLQRRNACEAQFLENRSPLR